MDGAVVGPLPGLVEDVHVLTGALQLADEAAVLGHHVVIGLPLAGMMREGRVLESLILLGTAFVLSRICDILKPTPARQLQRVRGGWGIVLDDWFASVYALILTHGAADLIEAKLFPLIN